LATLVCSFACSARSGRSPPFPTRRSSDLDRHWPHRRERHLPDHRNPHRTQMGHAEMTGRTGRNDYRLHVDPAAVEEAAKLLYIRDRKSTRLNSSHVKISYAVFCSKKKIKS